MVRLRLFVGVAAAAVIVTLLIVLGALGRGGDGDGGGDGAVVLPSPLATDVPRQGRVLGDADAPVTVIEYADFQ